MSKRCITGTYVEVESKFAVMAEGKDDCYVLTPGATGRVSRTMDDGTAVIGFHGIGDCQVTIPRIQKLKMKLVGLYISGPQGKGTIELIDGDGDAKVQMRRQKEWVLAKDFHKYKMEQNSWDPLGLTGPDGSLTQMLEFVPVTGHAIEFTHYMAGYDQQKHRGSARVTNTTSYVPLAGQVQAISTGLNGNTVLADKSMARSTATTVGVAVTVATAGTAAAGAAAGGVAGWGAVAACGAGSALAGRVTQLTLEQVPGFAADKEITNASAFEWAMDISLGAAMHVGCTKGFGTYAFANKAAGVDGSAALMNSIMDCTVDPASKATALEILQEVGEEMVAKGCVKRGVLNAATAKLSDDI